MKVIVWSNRKKQKEVKAAFLFLKENSNDLIWCNDSTCLWVIVYDIFTN